MTFALLSECDAVVSHFHKGLSQLTYSPDRLDREVRLAIAHLSFLTEWTIGEDAGLRMLDLPKDSHFPDTRHPDELPPVTDYEIGRRVSTLESYVHSQQWANSVADDIRRIRFMIEGVFPPSVVAEYEAEKADGEWEHVPGPFENGAGDVPLGYFHNGLMSQLTDLATARFKVDQDEPLTMGEIALLTGKRDATVTTTAYRKVFPTYEHDGKRYAATADVLPWLVQNGYLPTQGRDDPSAAAPTAEREEEYLFVPVARDGSIFAPSCASGGRFTVGEKEGETKYDNYQSALEALQRMPTPRWRRPGPKGAPGIVAGVRFERLARSRVEAA